MFPHIRQQLTIKMKEDDQQAIEEKDAVIALMNDDLQDRDNQIQAIKYGNLAFQDTAKKYFVTIRSLGHQEN